MFYAKMSKTFPAFLFRGRSIYLQAVFPVLPSPLLENSLAVLMKEIFSPKQSD